MKYRNIHWGFLVRFSNYTQKAIKIYILSTQEVPVSTNALKSQCTGKRGTGLSSWLHEEIRKKGRETIKDRSVFMPI